jgi:hypothetical protein
LLLFKDDLSFTVSDCLNVRDAVDVERFLGVETSTVFCWRYPSRDVEEYDVVEDGRRGREIFGTIFGIGCARKIAKIRVKISR